MKKIIIKDDDRVIGKFRMEKFSDFDETFANLKRKHDKIEYEKLED